MNFKGGFTLQSRSKKSVDDVCTSKNTFTPIGFG